MSLTMQLPAGPCTSCSACKTQGLSAQHPGRLLLCRRPAFQRHLWGRQLPGAASNGTKCRAFFKFGKNGLKSEDAGVYGSQGRDDYTYDDVEQYFNYMGMLADAGSYDQINKLNDSGLAAVDILLIMAAGENDTPKVAELLRAGADANVKDPDTGKLPVELATSDAVLELLREKSKA